MPNRRGFCPLDGAIFPCNPPGFLGQNCLPAAQNPSLLDTSPIFKQALTTLKAYLSGQASDSWGEGFEQWEIEVDGGELYIHLWNSEDWSIQTEQERFAPQIADGLPEMCFSTLKTTSQLICIKRGESGYHPSEWDIGDKERNMELADEL